MDELFQHFFGNVSRNQLHIHYSVQEEVNLRIELLAVGFVFHSEIRSQKVADIVEQQDWEELNDRLQRVNEDVTRSILLDDLLDF